MSLAELQSRGLLDLLDTEVARNLCRITGDTKLEVELAVALTSRNVRRGHACFPISMSAKDVWPDDDARSEALPDAARWREALLESRLTRDGPLVLDGAGRLYFRRYWQLEQDIADQLAARSALPSIVVGTPSWLEGSLERLFPGAPDSASRRAATNALEHRVSLLCGGPGTGKTTTVAAVVALILEARLQETGTAPAVMLLAPTGKSAVRLGEAVRRAKSHIRASDEVLSRIPEQATTVHRALGMQREGMRFRRSADLPLGADVIVLDEASMVDLGLMRQLLDATPREATLLIVGDPDQLTSVEAGSVLRDLVTASDQTWWRGRVTQLTKTFRYDDQQPLGRLITAVKKGDWDSVNALLGTADSDGVVWIPPEGLDAELDRAATHWSEALATRDPHEHFELRGRYVMLTPFRRGPIGTSRIASAMRDRLSASRRSAAPATPIIIEENSHELRLYNGDFAMLIDGQPPVATVQDDTGGFRQIAQARLPRFSDAFALSVHKAQGSEFEEVLLVLPDQDAPLLTRELVYTAVSRARARLRIAGSKEVLAAALTRRAKRHSGLVDAIERARA